MSPNELISKARINKNLTQEYLADQIGVSARTMSRIENQKRFLKFSELIKICSVLDLDPYVFYSEHKNNDHEKKERLIPEFCRLDNCKDENTLQFIGFKIKRMEIEITELRFLIDRIQQK